MHGEIHHAPYETQSSADRDARRAPKEENGRVAGKYRNKEA
jgi:hypothetical protein